MYDAYSGNWRKTRFRAAYTDNSLTVTVTYFYCLDTSCKPWSITPWSRHLNVTDEWTDQRSEWHNSQTLCKALTINIAHTVPSTAESWNKGYDSSKTSRVKIFLNYVVIDRTGMTILLRLTICTSKVIPIKRWGVIRLFLHCDCQIRQRCFVRQPKQTSMTSTFVLPAKFMPNHSVRQ